MRRGCAAGLGKADMDKRVDDHQNKMVERGLSHFRSRAELTDDSRMHDGGGAAAMVLVVVDTRRVRERQ